MSSLENVAKILPTGTLVAGTQMMIQDYIFIILKYLRSEEIAFKNGGNEAVNVYLVDIWPSQIQSEKYILKQIFRPANQDEKQGTSLDGPFEMSGFSKDAALYKDPWVGIINKNV